MKLILRYFACGLVIMSSFTPEATAETIVDHVNQGSVVVTQPAALNARLERRADIVVDGASSESEIIATTPKVRAGYRIQVFDDNNVRTAKQEAQNRKSMILSRFPELNAYVSFNSPYWRVKVGDFKSRGEAESVLAEMRQAFPSLAKSLRIVRDRVNQ